MPREGKKRGRRQQEKEGKTSAKRLKTEHTRDEEIPSEVVVEGDAGDDFISFDVERPQGIQEPQEETQFHGLLTPEEQEYYANVNTKIVANDFESPEDRDVFLEAVHRETEGKEMKVASSQSCSRYLEKIIMLSTPEQLRHLFSKFLGNLTYLVRHRFGSHCCETLFLEAAKHVEREPHVEEASETDLVGFENLFLRAAEELEPNMGFLLTDRFASHTIRVLFLVLSGLSLEDDSVKAMVASKRKEKLEAPVEKETETHESKRVVPKTFRNALGKLISSAISALDTTYLRALATHPTGNPVLQLLLRVELSASGKNKAAEENSVFRKLLPDQELEEDSESAKFISGLIYDPTGSHLVEILVKQLPGKAFKKLYKHVLKPRLGSMSKNDTASYVAMRILERLGKDDLDEAKTLILAELPVLISRRRTGLIRVLIERCALRGVDLQDVSDVIKSEYSSDGEEFLPNLLSFRPMEVPEQPADKDGNKGTQTSTPKTDVHGSLLAQTMLQNPRTCTVVQDSLLSPDPKVLMAMSRDPASSRVVQSALSPTESNMQFRREFVPRFYGHISDLAQDLTGSYVADALWSATDGLHFMKERLAGELASNESQLRDSPFGRNVWKNWAMDLYHRRPGEWRALAKGLGQSRTMAVPLKEAPGQERKKTPIELARERHSQKVNSHSAKNSHAAARSTNAVVRTNA
ncbi:uncharacterized protein Z520_01722 [Fonsecaea multimorphosa CBS 102226]|uniref:Nucleolar protein 9 n=1 Tax=Fonsecaea multimorphosa CBS 102226 TaxID=1442371 RepID=A0A0D2KIE9_9EURO|nr:uncharacterized protein Z520_01722 [Fonsecaea multimorphosa CBS 102226]KIY03255.1 hypothetical protein Z520_01722 [Fonsecaea multimorphosa CBS 102226]OAL30174.1 hypothetical protein AYO22_01690 [Fonsecaea multimorphosa]